MNPTVVFSIRSRILLEQRLAPVLPTRHSAVDETMTDIRQTLRAVFPTANVVVVQDLYSGFRVRTGEYIFLVEVTESGDQDGLSVLKLGPPERLSEEWEAWLACRPHGLRHDIVLMDLRRIPETGAITALLYADAEQLIGVDRALPLEEAVSNAVRLGEPTLDSVGDLLFQLYERLGILLYRHSADTDLAGEPFFAPHCLDRNLLGNLAEWESEGALAGLRATANTQSDTRALFRLFRDPVNLLRGLLAAPNTAEYLPRMLRGRSHGDLHARNVLVGQVGDRVLWPAVYDFGNMSRQNWIGWDFVKMEVELKVRLYPALFPVVAASVLPFEARLCEATEAGRDNGRWPPLSGWDRPEDRLHALLVHLRRLAGRHLSHLGRSRLWLSEYYFLLAVYGLNAARFRNLSLPELLAGYLAAGAAAARFYPVPERSPK